MDAHLFSSNNKVTSHHTLFVVGHIEQYSRRVYDARREYPRRLFRSGVVFAQVFVSPSNPLRFPPLSNFLPFFLLSSIHTSC